MSIRRGSGARGRGRRRARPRCRCQATRPRSMMVWRSASRTRRSTYLSMTRIVWPGGAQPREALPDLLAHQRRQAFGGLVEDQQVRDWSPAPGRSRASAARRRRAGCPCCRARSSRRGKELEHLAPASTGRRVRSGCRRRRRGSRARSGWERSAGPRARARCPGARCGRAPRRSMRRPRKRDRCPARARVRPMIERTVVVLPMPLRPSSVDRLRPAAICEVDAEQHLARAVGGLEVLRRSSSKLVSRRGRPCALRDRLRIAAGAPVAMTRPSTSTEMRSARRNTASMSCSTSSTVTLRADARDQRDHALRFLRPHAGHRLVEQHQLRLRGEREADLERALLAVARACSPTCDALVAETDLGGDARALRRTARVSRAHRPPEREARAAARLHREREVVEHGEAPEDAGDLVAAREARRDALRAAAGG